MKGNFRLNVFLSIFFPALLYFYCFIISSDFLLNLILLVIAHGIPYISVLILSVKRTKIFKFNSVYLIALIVLVSALFLGVFENYLEEFILNISNDYIYYNYSFFEILFLAFYLVPLLSHFIFDSYIWTSKHREAKLIYKP